MLMSRHLQQHIWSESAYTLEAVKSTRWHIGSAGKSAVDEGLWRDILTMTRTKQTLFLQRLHFGFMVRRKQVCSAAHARLNAEQWDSLADTTCLLLWAVERMQVAKNEDGLPMFGPDCLRAAMQKILEGCLAISCNCLFPPLSHQLH